ncbi:MAG: FecR domain-containing protein [Rudaea sp.]|uniref:FecR family protein n=1 Tax=Rudaea sp. TaxID=2136325 RepID=UPI0039E2E3B8
MRRLTLAAAATLAAVALGTVAYRSSLSWQHFETPVGEQRTIQLTEGSVVNLNVQSRLDVRFDETQRDVRLLQGEATFKVAHDRTRPFRVHTARAVVEAVGTQFNVDDRPDGTTNVAVIEGRVKVSGAGPLASDPVLVAAGEEARVQKNGRVDRVDHADVAEAVVWQQRKLIFKRTALEDITTEFNRYNKGMQFRLEGIAPGAYRFTGAFNADDPESLAALLKQEPDLAVEKRSGEIFVRPRGGAKATRD